MVREIKIYNSESDVIEKLCELICTQANSVINSGCTFKVGLSGGSLIKFLCKGFPNVTTDWTKWLFFFCDERLVPFEDGESTFGCYKRNLLANVPLEEKQFITINPALTVNEAAEDYCHKLEEHFPSGNLPKFDLLLLGVGPDGHTCSLFPGHDALKESEKWVIPISDSPKPPPCRITLTLPVLNNAHNVIFAASGAGKAEIINQSINILKDDKSNPLPASMVNPTAGSLYWILDVEAASLLEKL